MRCIRKLMGRFEELLKELESFEGNYFEFYLKVKEGLNKKQRKALKETLKKLKPRRPPSALLFCEDVVNYKKVLQPEVADFVITDPPYGRKYLPLYETLSELSHYVLKEGGVLIVMTGQSHLPEVIKRLSKKLRYVWTLAYLTPGGQSPFLWHIRCNTFWKPVLVFSKGKCKIDSFGSGGNQKKALMLSLKSLSSLSKRYWIHSSVVEQPQWLLSKEDAVS